MSKPNTQRDATGSNMQTKKVLLVIIDGLASRVVLPALEAGRLPNLQRLRNLASWTNDSIAIFPSITPAATSSLITGRYPCDHRIAGAYWYDADEKRVVYYGYDFWAILEEGIETFFKDFVVELNEEHLKAKSIFQRVEERGLTAGSLNYLIYRGDHPHKLKLPLPRRLLPAVVNDLLPVAPPEVTVDGPTLLYFGDLIETTMATGEKLSHAGGPFNRLGFNDESTIDLLMQLLPQGKLPAFTVAYFPDNDFRSHEVGPEEALDKLEELDQKLGEVFDEAGGLEQLLSNYCIVVTGDHSHSDVVADSEAAGIRLDKLLGSFSVATAGSPMNDEDDLVICPNLRTAQIYFHTPTAERFERVIAQLAPDPRIDQIMWSARLLEPAERGFHIMTTDRGRLHFWPGRDGSQSARDPFGNVWGWTGDLATVDGRVSDGAISFGDYPNAFERIANVLELDNAGHLWATSRPGYEFCLEHTLIHPGGGSHGSLHALDSLSPLWVVAAPRSLPWPEQARAVDVAPLCLALLGLEAYRS